MKQLCMVFCLLFLASTTAASLPSDAIYAAGSDILIAQAAPNGAAASNEYVSIYNNSDTDVDVTNWCVKYNGSSAKPGCLAPPDTATRLYLTARTYTTFASTEFVAAHPGFIPQAKGPFVAGIADSGGTLTVVDAAGATRDQFSWSKKLLAGQVYQRNALTASLLSDTDSDVADFGIVLLVLPASPGLYEYAPPQDMCPNIPDIQEAMPFPFEQNSAGSCVVDQCINLVDLQELVPAGYESHGNRMCELILVETAPIDITEVYPNPPSYDTGQEFVEVYNPNVRPVSLGGYQLQFGPNYYKSFTLPDVILEEGAYRFFTDTDLGFSLPNTSGAMRLLNPNGQIVFETPEYSSPPEGESWVAVTGTWQLTDRVTPGATNIQHTEDGSSEGETPAVLAACPTGKYRNPLTNRCRNIEQAGASLTPCATDQYRSSETNRCRKLTALSSGLAACKAGQTRNSDTNRCRSNSVATSSQKPCESGYERNTETNRCRKAAVAKPTLSDDPTSTRSTNNVLTALLLTMTLSYAAYEYRYDVVNLYHRLRLRRELRRTS